MKNKNDYQVGEHFWQMVLMASLAGLLLWGLVGCSASEVKGAVHGIGVPTSAAIAAGIASGGNPVVVGATPAATAGSEMLLPTGKEDAIRETVEALSKGEAVDMFASRGDMKASSSFSNFLAFTVLAASLGYTWWRRRKAQGKYDLLDKLKAEVEGWGD